MIFNALITVLVVAGSLGVYSILIQNDLPTKTYPTDTSQTSKQQNVPTETSNKVESTQKDDTARLVETQSLYKKILSDVNKKLDLSQYGSAVELINSVYQQLSSIELDELENLFLSRSQQLRKSEKTLQAISLLTHYGDTFNSLNAWILLSNIHLENNNWQPAISSLLKAISLEFRPEKIQLITSNLILAASSQRALLESKKDELGINLLYKNLYEKQPNITRFQFELAFSYLRLDDKSNAKILLESLQYYPEYASIVESALSKLETNTVANIENSEAKSNNRNEIVVPLQRSGNSFFTSTSINNRQLRLLLDTGASITSLSKDTIRSLNLKPTGQSIRLSTANGITRAQLYRADQIRLGSLKFKNLTVAEIDLGQGSRIDGLLGTDLLNQLNNRYTYIIDNEKNALIFKAKN